MFYDLIPLMVDMSREIEMLLDQGSDKVHDFLNKELSRTQNRVTGRSMIMLFCFNYILLEK